MSRTCVFCEIVNGDAPATIVETWPEGVVAFKPLNPVTDGHTLIVPKSHVADATENPDITAVVMRAASDFARDFDATNIITNCGEPATQSVFHLHLHVVPRRDGDGLRLPWS